MIKLQIFSLILFIRLEDTNDLYHCIPLKSIGNAESFKMNIKDHTENNKQNSLHSSTGRDMSTKRAKH